MIHCSRIDQRLNARFQSISARWLVRINVILFFALWLVKGYLSKQHRWMFLTIADCRSTTKRKLMGHALWMGPLGNSYCETFGHKPDLTRRVAVTLGTPLHSVFNIASHFDPRCTHLIQSIITSQQREHQRTTYANKNEWILRKPNLVALRRTTSILEDDLVPKRTQTKTKMTYNLSVPCEKKEMSWALLVTERPIGGS